MFTAEVAFDVGRLGWGIEGTYQTVIHSSIFGGLSIE